MTKVDIPTRAGRRVFPRPCSVTRVALVGQTPTDRLIATSSLGALPSPISQQFFTSVSDAVTWLLQDEKAPA